MEKERKERTVYINERTNMYLKEYLESRKDNDPALLSEARNRIATDENRN